MLELKNKKLSSETIANMSNMRHKVEILRFEVEKAKEAYELKLRELISYENLYDGIVKSLNNCDKDQTIRV